MVGCKIGIHTCYWCLIANLIWTFSIPEPMGVPESYHLSTRLAVSTWNTILLLWSVVIAGSPEEHECVLNVLFQPSSNTWLKQSTCRITTIGYDYKLIHTHPKGPIIYTHSSLQWSQYWLMWRPRWPHTNGSTAGIRLFYHSHTVDSVKHNFNNA
jgi:hypothetical protein